MTRGRLTFTFGDLPLQPVEREFVATRLVDLALGPGPAAYDRATDVAGPEVLTIADLLPSPGAADIGGRRFAEWLAEQPPVLSGC